MSDADILLRQAQHEIRRLRESNQILSAQVFVVEAFHAALLGRPTGMGMSPDLCWEIERHLNPRPKAEEEGEQTVA